MMRLASCLHHTVNGRSDYRTELCSVWEQQVNTALKLKQRADMISTFLNGDHVSVSSIHTRCRIAVKPLTTWEKTGGTRRTTTLSALLQVKANHSPATLGAFQLPQGIIEGLRCEEGNCCKWCRRRRQFKETTVGFLPAYTVQACQKKASNQHLYQASLPWNVRKHWTLCSATSLSPPLPLSRFWFSQVIFDLHICL